MVTVAWEITRALIPINGTHMTTTFHPPGYFVASYDAEGFTTAGRWFPEYDEASDYAHQLDQQGSKAEWNEQ